MRDNRTIENKLSSAVSELIPADMFDRIEQGIVQNQERTILIMKKTNNKRILPRITGILVAACLLLAVGLIGFSHYQDNLAVTSSVDIDVNPSLAISANRKDRVVKVEAVNDDAKAVLGNMDLKGVDLEVAVNAIIGSMVKTGYLTELGEILVTVHSSDEHKAKEIRSFVVANIDAALKENEVDATILNQTVANKNPSEAAKTFAEANGISVGKAIFVQKLAAKDETLIPEELAQKSIKELTALIRDKKLDVHDVIDYDEEDSHLDPPAETDVPEENGSGDGDHGNGNNGNQKINAARAKEIALAHAGFAKKDVTFVKVELDKENGRTVYEVEFVKDRVEYDYEIDALTGEILSAEQEDREDGRRPIVPNPNGDKPTTDAPSSSPAELLSDEAAEDIALNHAGVTRNDAKALRSKLDREDGRTVYEIEFRVGKTEYEYEIDAYSGAVLKAESDVDDDHRETESPERPVETAAPETAAPSVTPSALLSAEEAEEIALDHAGIARTNAVSLHAELDRENGKTVYEIEFRVGKVEYEYEIDAYSGAVLKAESDVDD